MNKINYQLELDKIINKIEGENTTKSLLLHSCCAPCSSYVLAYLNKYFNITVFYYNPNITNKEEYLKRKQEQIRLISELPAINKINILDADYNPEKFFEISKGLENCREGGERCFKCYKLRLEATAKAAKENSFNYFCTTLTISPLKNAQKINEMGQMLGDEYQISFLPSDFKKKEGFKKSLLWKINKNHCKRLNTA